MQLYKINEIYNHKYYKIPKELFTNDKYKKLNSDAKIIYSMLLDRMELSAKNNWYDENGDIYLIFTRKSIQDLLGLSDKPVTKAFKQLSDLGLIKEKRQGLTKPNIIYIGKIEHENIDKFKNRKMSDSENGEYPIQKSANVRTNDTNINNTDIINNNKAHDPNTTDIKSKDVVVENKNNNNNNLDNINQEAIATVREFIIEPIADKDIRTLLKVANNNIDIIKNKYYIVKATSRKIKNLVAYLINAIVKNYQAVSVEPSNKCSTSNKNRFNNFDNQHDWDFEELERLEFEYMCNYNA